MFTASVLHPHSLLSSSLCGLLSPHHQDAIYSGPVFLPLCLCFSSLWKHNLRYLSFCDLVFNRAILHYCFTAGHFSIAAIIAVMYPQHHMPITVFVQTFMLPRGVILMTNGLILILILIESLLSFLSHQ